MTEILVVMVIIAVIAALLIQVVGRIRVSSQAATSIERIRQCGLIVKQKAIDNSNMIVIHVNGTSSKMQDLRLYGMVQEIVGEKNVGRYVYTPAYEKQGNGTWPVWGTNIDNDPENNIIWEKVWFQRGGEQRYAEGLNLARCGTTNSYPLLADSSNANSEPRARFANDDVYKFAMRYNGKGPVFMLDGSAQLVGPGDMRNLGIQQGYLFKDGLKVKPTLVRATSTSN
jgi:hypothetical protein